MAAAALYIDLDNMLGYCYSLSYPFAPEVLTSFIKEQGDELVFAKGYGSISSALPHLDNFLDEEEIHNRLCRARIIYAHCAGKKNTADLTMSLDALSALDGYEILYLVSSDADFQPLADRLAEQGKRVVFIRLFQPYARKSQSSFVKEVLYPNLLGITTEDGLDAKALVYREILESILKMAFINPERLKEITAEAVVQFTPGIHLSDLARCIARKDAFKVLRTALLGRGFMSDPVNKNLLLAIRGGRDDLRSAFYRQCFYLLKKNLVDGVSEPALNKTFMLRREAFSVEDRKLTLLPRSTPI